MATITVTGLTDEFVQRLEQKAAANNRSPEDEIRHILERAMGDNATGMEAKRKAFLKRARELRKLTEGQLQTPSEILIREDRDSDHGRLRCD